jgi:hypothetical protein
MAPFSTLTIKNRDYVALSLALLVYRANENRKRCALLSKVTQTNLRNIENFKTKTTGKKQMMFCIVKVAFQVVHFPREKKFVCIMIILQTTIFISRKH